MFSSGMFSSRGMPGDCLVKSIPSRVVPAGFFISYACAPGTVPMEPRDGQHRYYTQALLELINSPEQLTNVLGDVAAQVEDLELSGAKQRCFQTNNARGKNIRASSSQSNGCGMHTHDR